MKPDTMHYHCSRCQKNTLHTIERTPSRELSGLVCRECNSPIRVLEPADPPPAPAKRSAFIDVLKTGILLCAGVALFLAAWEVTS